MIKGMTAFSEADIRTDEGPIHLSVRCVNGKSLQVRTKLPNELAQLEGAVQEIVKRYIRRGRIEVDINWKCRKQKARINEELAAEYLRGLTGLSRKLGIKGSLSISDVLRLPGVFELRDQNKGGGELWRPVKKALEQALKDADSMRKREGRGIEKDLRDRLKRLVGLTHRIRIRERAAAAIKKNNLTAKVSKIIGGSGEPAWEEIVRIVERMNIDEELQRTGEHLKYFSHCMKESGAGGSKLDYIVQEIWREVNTTGSKVEDFQVRKAVVEMKEELNRMREQLANVE